MEISQEKKNNAIALILGWKPIKPFTSTVWCIPCKEGEKWILTHKGKEYKEYLYKGLQFHSNVNQQLEAIDFIVKHNEIQYSLLMYAQSVTVQFKTLSSTSITIVKRTDGDVKAAIFDALYNVSKYLKTNKPCKS